MIYNANGREIGSYDSQPTKFTIREVAVAGTLHLDRLIAQQPALAERAGFVIDRQGRYRSAYSLVPVVVAAGPAMLLQTLGLVDFDAPLATNLIAALTASVLTAAAVTLVFLAISRLVCRSAAVATAVALGLGTNYWALVSQTLWLHECVAVGTALSLWAWLRPITSLRQSHVLIGSLGLAVAGMARLQIAPLVLLMFTWLVARIGRHRATLPAIVVVVCAAAGVGLNLYWFGHPLGALPRLQADHLTTHLRQGSLSTEPWTGAAGLLISPSRGLLVFSPVVALALLGFWARSPRDWDSRLGWLAGAGGVQFMGYSFFSVWWAGHTYGPRLLLDLLVPLAPLMALGIQRARSASWSTIAVLVLLVWSIAVAGAGAFVYPNERWNTDPSEVDRDHSRLWNIRDSQIIRAFSSPPSPQNFQLLDRAAIRRQ